MGAGVFEPVKQRFESGREIAAALGEGFGRRALRQPAQGCGEFERGAAERPSLRFSDHGCYGMHFLANHVADLSVGAHMRESKFVATGDSIVTPRSSIRTLVNPDNHPFGRSGIRTS